MKRDLSENNGSKFPGAVLLIFRSIISGFLVSTSGVAVWSLLVMRINTPWSILPMLFVLWAFLKFFSGNWRGMKNRESKSGNGA
jgi:hypothetical protein